MPRPIEQESKQPEGWWERKSLLERILMPLTLLVIIFIIVLLFLVAKKEVDFTLKYCNSTGCIKEASKIASYIDPAINPCDDFYQFACGNFLKDAHGDKSLYMLQILQEQAKRELFEAYIEPIQEDDHKMVKAAKQLFKACMNETEIEMDNLYTIKEALKAVGGWPVVEGPKWNDGVFHWVDATYKLRELGYHFSVFLDLVTVVDPDDSTKHIFKVATPDMWDYSSLNFDKIGFMTDVAVLFGAQDKSKASGEMAKAHNLLTRLQLEIHNQFGLGGQTKYTVKEYQKKCPNLNWYEFINKIASPPAEISEDDKVLFPAPAVLSSWIDLISKTPKRTQANYMMWKVIEAALPYLTEDVQSLRNTRRKPEHRKEFCLREIQERFIHSPIDIVCDRKYLPKENWAKVDKISDNIKSEFIEALGKIYWINETDKEEVLEKAKAIKIVIGQPGDYFDDKIFDDLDVDMVPTKNNTFLSLISQANRNRQTTLYQQINKLTTETLSQKWVFKSGATFPLYSEEDDIIYIPGVGVSNFLFDESRPNYVNYGALGVQVGLQMTSMLNKYLSQEQHEKIKCMEDAMKDLQPHIDRFQINLMMHVNAGGHLASAAYEKWINSHGKEQHLITIDYSPKQLFWISAVLGYCEPLSSYGSMPKSDLNIVSRMVSESISHIPQFVKDFECPEGAKMNPSKRCSLL